MSQNRIFFDQSLLQKDFASFSDDDLFGSKSFIGSIINFFSKESDFTFNSSFSFARDSTGNYASLIVGTYFYVFNLKTNKYQTIKIPTNNSTLSTLAFLEKGKENLVGILSKSTVFYFSYENSLNLKNQITLKVKGDKILCLKNDLFVVTTSNSLVRVSPFETVIPNLNKNYVLVCTSYETVAFVHQTSLTIISSDFSTITPSNVPFTDPQDATFSKDGNFLYVIDKKVSKLFVFNAHDGFELSDTVDLDPGLSLSYVCSWPCSKSVVCTYNEFGSLIFIALETKQTQQLTIKPHCVLRGTNDGFLMFELEDQKYGDSFHFNLIRFTSVTPFELYQRNCEQGFFGDALVLLRTFNFDKDIYFKAYLKQNELNVRTIDDVLMKIEDKNWIYYFCCQTVADSAEVSEKLIKTGLQVRQRDPELLKLKERLHLFIQISKESGFVSNDWQKFKTCDLITETMNYAKKSQFQKIEIILKGSSELDDRTKMKIVSKISLFTSPAKYAKFLPRNAEMFRLRAKEIDQITGQTELIVDLLKIGANYIQELNIDYILAMEFDNFICEISNEDDKSHLMSFEEYLKMKDDDRLMLFVKNSVSGEFLNKILQTIAKSIIERSPSSLSFILSEPLQTTSNNSKNSVVFPNMKLNDRIKEISVVLKEQNIDFSKKYCTEILGKISFPLDFEFSDTIQDKWRKYLSESSLKLLKFASYAAKFDTPLKFSALSSNKLDTNLVLKVAANISQLPENADKWKQFFSFAKTLFNNESSSKYLLKLSELNLSALILLREFDDIEIKTSIERDIAVAMTQKLIDQAKSCDINDPLLSGAVQCISMVPPDLKNNIINSLFQRFSLYQHIYALDTQISPKKVNESASINSLLLAIINSKKPSSTNDLPKFCDLLINKVIKHQFDGVDEKSIYSALAINCLRDGFIEYGVNNLIVNSDEDVVVKYMKDERWKDVTSKEKICNQMIEKADKSNLQFFVDFKLNLIQKTEVVSNPSLILNYMETCEKDKVFNFCFSIISYSSSNSSSNGETGRIELMKNYCSSCEEPCKFNNLVLRMQKLGLLNENENEIYKKMYEESLYSSEDNDVLYQRIAKASSCGIPVNKETKFRVFTIEIINKEMKLNIDSNLFDNKNDFVVNSIIDLVLKSKDKIDECKGCLIKLLKNWYECDIVVNEEKLLLLMTSILSQKEVNKERKFFSDILSEKLETEYVDKMSNSYFSVTSIYPKVVEKALSLNSISNEAIDYIIENNLTHLFVDNDKCFEAILVRAKSKQHARKIVETLLEKNKIESVVKFAQFFLNIPKQFCTQNNAEQIVSWINSVFC